MNALIKHKKEYSSFEKEIAKEINEIHQHSPKYIYCEESQEEVLIKNKVEIIKLEGNYLRKESGLFITNGDAHLTPEEFVADYFRKQGFDVLFMESVPFHVLFGNFLWILIQDPSDPDLQMISFGDRNAFEKKETPRQITTFLPKDFGTTAYSARRIIEINKHFEFLPKSREDLLWTFDYWLGPSADLRQYLWAHRNDDIKRARQITEIMPVNVLIQILKYLLGNYWHRYCGWPDLLVYNCEEYFFAEVKSSNDKLSENQKNWIKGNSIELHIPFKLVKIHKMVDKCSL